MHASVTRSLFSMFATPRPPANPAAAGVSVWRERPWQVTCVGLIVWVCAVGWAGAARADVLERFYADLGVGWSYANTLELADDAIMDLDRGTDQLSGAVGRRFGDDWRVELEFAEFANDPELLYSTSAGIEVDTDERDSVETSSVMVNLLRDFRVGTAWRPYLGVGAGVGTLDVHFSEIEISGPFFQRPRRDIINDEDSGLAMQFIAGVTVPLTRRLELAADFRYWHMPDVELEEVSGAAVDTDHSLRSAWLHLRYNGSSAGVFNGPAPRQAFQRGWYLTSNLGGAFALDEEIEDTTLVIDAFDLGTVFTVGAGYRWHPRWRAELEAGYWDNDVQVMEFSKDVGEDSATGSVESYSLLLNVYFQFAPESSVRPFVGLGGGWLRSSYDITTAGFCRNFVCDPVEQRALLIDDEATTTAVQALVGVDVAIDERWRFTAAFRQLLSNSIEMEQADGTPFDVRRRWISSVTAGFHYSLGR